MDGLDAKQLTAAERRSEPRAGVALRVARLAGTPSKSRSSEHGRLRACELAVRDAPRDVACRGERATGQSAPRAAGSGDVGSQCPRTNRPFPRTLWSTSLLCLMCPGSPTRSQHKNDQGSNTDSQ